jgi:hypothetical protein
MKASKLPSQNNFALHSEALTLLSTETLKDAPVFIWWNNTETSGVKSEYSYASQLKRFPKLN